MAVPERQCRLRHSFRRDGCVLETLWDLAGENHPAITSMREHRGYLYLAASQQSRRADQARRRRSALDGPGLLLGERQ